MHKTSWILRILGCVALMASVLVTVWAQNDENSLIVSEEMTIDEAVNPGTAAAEDIAATELPLETEVTDLEAAVGDTLVMPDEAAELTTTAEPVVDMAPEAEVDLGALTEEAPAVESMDVLAVEAEAPVAMEEAPDAEATDTFGLETLAVEEEAAPVVEQAPIAEESATDLTGLEVVEEEKGVPAAEAASAFPADDLAGLELAPESASGDASGVSAMESEMLAVESGVPADLAAEEGSVDSAMTVGETVDVDAMLQEAAAASESSGMESQPGEELETSDAMETGMAAGAVGASMEEAGSASSSAEAVTPVPAASTGSSRKSTASRRQPDKAVQMLREGEELRRRAFVEHASEKLTLADEAFKSKNFNEAQRFYEQAANALEQAGGRPENRAELKRAKEGALECLYRRALELRSGGDLDDARKLASEAAVQGHPRAASLVEKLDREATEPPAPPQAEKVRWKQDDYVEKTKSVQEKLHKGREYFMANELDKAQEQFEAVLDIDAHNTEAIRWREKVTQTRFERASMELETTRNDMMSQVRETWNPRDYGAGEEPQPIADPNNAPKNQNDPSAMISEKMEGIIIPEIDFRQANINDVVQFLQESSIEYDASPGKKGVNIILNLSGAEGGAIAAVLSDDGFGGDFGSTEAPVSGGGGADLITFRAREISLLEALKIVTDVANLKYRIEGNVVMILPINAAEGHIVHRMYDVLPTVGERISAIRESTASDAGGDFGGSLSAGGNAGGDAGMTDWKAFFGDLGVQWPIGSTIKYVAAIGKLMVANTPDNLAVFEQRLSALNIVPRQVEIEARFVEVNQTDLNSLGFEWLLTDDWEIAQKKTDANLPLSAQQRVVMPQSDFTTGNRYVTDNALSDQAPENLTTATDNILGIASVLTNPELSVILHALEQKGHADLLSAPKVTTQSGIEAQIKVVTEYIYPSDYTIEPGVSPTLNSDGSVQSAGTPPVVTPAEFETREVGVILRVLPEVSTEGEMINLTMSPEVVTDPTWRNYGQEFTDAAGNTLRIPIEQPFFHSRSISTSILIYNGATVVMGGMITEDRQQVDDRIPFLGDIPLIGRLFRSTYDNSVKKNLLIFVTARLVDPAGRPVGSARTNPQVVDFAPAPVSN